MSAPGPFVVAVRRKVGPLEQAGQRSRSAAGVASPASLGDPCVVYREAFATLELVRKRILDDHYRVKGMGRYVRALSESGGTLSLPSGDVIEVEATTWQRMVSDVQPCAGSDLAEILHKPAILAAWNAEHGIGIGEEARHA